MNTYSTKLLSEQEIERLANTLAKDPEFGKALAEAVAEHLGPILDEKYGFYQGWMKDTLEELKKGQANTTERLDHMDRRFDAVGENFNVLRQHLDLSERKFNKRLDSIEGSLEEIDRNLLINDE